MIGLSENLASQAQEAASLGVGVVTSFVPVIDWVPGLNKTLGNALGKAGSQVAAKTITVGTKVVITRSAAMAASGAAPKVIKGITTNWGATKAFIMYLGTPKTDDPLYNQWVGYRCLACSCSRSIADATIGSDRNGRASGSRACTARRPRTTSSP